MIWADVNNDSFNTIWADGYNDSFNPQGAEMLQL